MPSRRRSRSPAVVSNQPPRLARTQSDCLEATRITDRHPRTLYQLGKGESISCGTEDIDPGSEVPWHEHEAAEEMLFCTGGKGTIYVGKDEISDFTKGVMVLVPRRTQHRIVNVSTSSVLSLAWALSPPQAPQQFRARNGTREASGGLASRRAAGPYYFPWLFPKLSAHDARHVAPLIDAMYYAPALRRKILHVTWCEMPRQPTLWSNGSRRLALCSAAACWILGVPLACKLRSLVAAVVYSFTEFGFTRFVERGGSGYTSSAQFWANVLYAAPCLLDGYRHLIHEIAVGSEAASFTAHGFVGFEATCFILLFPVNVWLYEALLGHALVWLYGTNVAWLYGDYADAFCSGHCRVGHAPFWWLLGACCYWLQPALKVSSDAAAAALTTAAWSTFCAP